MLGIKYIHEKMRKSYKPSRIVYGHMTTIDLTSYLIHVLENDHTIGMEENPNHNYEYIGDDGLVTNLVRDSLVSFGFIFFTFTCRRI